jgi:hypothetical protein
MELIHEIKNDSHEYLYVDEEGNPCWRIHESLITKWQTSERKTTEYFCLDVL